MKQSVEHLISLVNGIHSNNQLQVIASVIKPGYHKEDLEEIEKGLEVSFNDDLRDFFLMIGEISLLWSVKPGIMPEEDEGYITGSIQVLNPFDMIMGKTGTRWKDVLWFDHMNKEEIEEYKSFVPFDFPSTELISGFKLINGKLGGEMYLLNINEGISPLNLKLEGYLDFLINTKGFIYWQSFGINKESAEFRRFMKYMPALFTDFQPGFFK